MQAKPAPKGGQRPLLQRITIERSGLRGKGEMAGTAGLRLCSLTVLLGQILCTESCTRVGPKSCGCHGLMKAEWRNFLKEFVPECVVRGLGTSNIQHRRSRKAEMLQAGEACTEWRSKTAATTNHDWREMAEGSGGKWVRQCNLSVYWPDVPLCRVWRLATDQPLIQSARKENELFAWQS